MLTRMSVSFLILLASGFGTLADTGCPCVVVDSPPREGIHLFLPSDVLPVIATSQTCYVVHGWGIGAECAATEFDLEAYCAHARANMTFTLRINGAEVQPTSLEISYHENLLTGCGIIPTITGWGAAWLYEFPAGHFSPGVYVLEGTWISRYPMHCGPEGLTDCLSQLGGVLQEDGSLLQTIVRTTTLTVLRD